MGIEIAIPVIIGIIVGTQFSLMWQGILLFIAIIYCNSRYVASLELGAIFVIAMVFWFFIGVAIGDVSYALQTGDYHNWAIPNPFVVSK